MPPDSVPLTQPGEPTATAAPELCRHCDGEIVRFDLTMQGPRGPWVHRMTRRRMCEDDFSTVRYAEPFEDAAARLDRAVVAVERDYALFGDLHGRAVPIGRDTLRQILRLALEAADAT